MSSVNEWLADMFKNLVNDIISWVMALIAPIFTVRANVFDLPFLAPALLYVQTLSMVVLSIKLLNDGIQTYFLYRSGDPDADPRQLIINGAAGVAMIWTMPWIARLFTDIGARIIDDLLAMPTVGMDAFENMAQGILSAPMIPIYEVLLLLVLAIALLVAVGQCAMRNVETCILSVIGPFLGINAASGNRNLFSMWFKQIIVATCSQSIQFLMIKGCIYFVVTPPPALSGTGMHFLFALGWMVATISAPKFLKQFTYESGGGGVVGNAARAGSSIIQMIGRLK